MFKDRLVFSNTWLKIKNLIIEIQLNHYVQSPTHTGWFLGITTGHMFLVKADFFEN